MIYLKFFFFIILSITRLCVIAGICWYGECCDGNYVKHNFTELEINLEKYLFGQPLVKSTIINALKSHFKLEHPPSKALVLSFHGGTGTGKNHVAKIIANSFYKKSLESDFMLFYSASRDFPHNSKINEYKDKLKKEIEEKISKCKYSLFVFDEMDKIPIQLMDIIKPFVDFNNSPQQLNFQYAVFIFLSNSGSQIINTRTLDLNLNKTNRENFKLKMFQEIIENHIYNHKGEDQKGFWHLALIKNHLIDYYVPFLPLEREHVKKCIISEFKTHSIDNQNTKTFYKVIDYILEELIYEPKGYNLYSSSGCKRIPQLVRKFISDVKILDKDFRGSEL